MSDPKAFPSVEPPPHPESDNETLPVSKSPLSVMQPASNDKNPVNSQTVSTSGTPTPVNAFVPNPYQFGRKKGVPKAFIFVLIGVILITVILLLVLKIRSNKNVSLVGTKGEITWWGRINDENIVAPLIAEYEKLNPNLRIKYIKQSDKDYRERLTSALASGQGPDIYEIHNSWVPMFREDLSVIPERVINKEDFRKTFYSVMGDNLVTDAGIVGIPLQYDALTLYINDEIFTSALRSSPRTWDEVNQTAKDLTQRGQNKLIIQSGVALGLTNNIDHWPEIIGLMILQNGGSFSKFEMEPIKDSVNYFLHFSKTDKDWDSSMPVSTTAFAKNKLAMYFGPARRAADIIQMNPNLRFRTVPLPQLPKENPTDPDFSYATYWVESVWKRSNNSDAAWDFLKFMSSSESLRRMNGLRKENNLLEQVYPKPDMAIFQKDDNILGSVVVLAPYAKSWYLQDQTSDGETGINFQVNKVFSDTLSAARSSGELENALKIIQVRINEILTKYNTKRK